MCKEGSSLPLEGRPAQCENCSATSPWLRVKVADAWEFRVQGLGFRV